MPEDLMQRLAAGKARAHRSIAQTLGDCADGFMIAYLKERGRHGATEDEATPSCGVSDTADPDRSLEAAAMTKAELRATLAIMEHVPEPELDSMPDDACAYCGRT
jgi:hypothetical protein